MKPVVVTSEKKFSDIDALACSIAYSDFLKGGGYDAYVLISQNFNKSIIDSILGWKYLNAKIDESDREVVKDADFVIVDRSDPIDFAEFVDVDRVIEVFDHHLGMENYWQEKLGEKSHIEFVGACATLIFEKINEGKGLSFLDTISIDLLATAILAHTLNFNAQITTNRDREVYRALIQIGGLPKNWDEIYFEELEQGILADPKEAIINDIKEKEINGTVYIIGQNELWNSREFLKKNIDLITTVLDGRKTQNWFYLTPSVSEGKTYIVSNSKMVRKHLAKAIGARFKGNLGQADKLWLRKEIINELSKMQTKSG